MIGLLSLLGGGLVAGGLGGFLGLGGGIVLMPLLRFVLGLPPAQAAGTCVLAVCCTSVGGSYRHLRDGRLAFRPLVPVIASGVVASGLCSVAFGRLAQRGHWLDLGIGLVFAVVSARMIVGARRSSATAEPRPDGAVVGGPVSLKVAIGAVAGGLPGLLGIGTGGILVPAFSFLLGAPVKTAMGASLTCFAFTAAVSAAFKLWQGHVVLETALPLCLGTLLGANLGARANRRARAGVAQLAFGILFAFVSLRFIASFIGA